MTISNPFQYTPFGSISLLTEQEITDCVSAFYKIPETIQSFLSSADTGSFLVGLGKAYKTEEEKIVKISQTVLLIAIGKKTFAQLPSILSSELQLPMDMAQKMAGEIEKDLFGPVRNELNTFLQSQKGGTTSPNKMPPTKPMANMRNVLDLKEITPKQKQPQLPPKPISPSLLSAQKPSLQPKPPVPPKRPPGVPIAPIHFS